MHDIPSTWRKPVLLRVNHPNSFGPAALAEVEAMGYTPQDAGDTGYSVRGSMLDAIRLNRWLRVGHSVLYPVLSFTARHLRQFQEMLFAFPWEEWIRSDRRLCVESFASTTAIRDGRIVNQGAKDAIVDRLRDKTGVRPDSGPEPDQTVLFIFWNQHHVQVFLNTSGRSLSHRGYRAQTTDAPLRETLGAVCLARSGWNPATPLVNPMCGSGTIAIEAALLGAGLPPRTLSRGYGYQHLVGYTPAAEWDAPPPANLVPGKPRIVASERDPRALAVAKLNAETAGVAELIEFVGCDYQDTPMPDTPGTVIVNPPYGERIGADDDLNALYRGIGAWFRAKCPGWKCFLLSGNAEASLTLKLKTFQRDTLMNGPIPCKYLGFEMRKPEDAPVTERPPESSDTPG
jgi:23S rRNA G2445 N2-methylase RlmL